MPKTPTLTDVQAQRFWSKVDKTSDCWIWTGWMTSQGYGRFDVGPTKFLATHVVLALTGRPRPSAPNDYALHGDTCVSPACCNPAHLRWGTAAENAQDRERLERHAPAKGEKNGNSKITADVVRFVRSSPLPQRAVAKLCGISQPWVGKIRRREVWQHVA